MTQNESMERNPQAAQMADESMVRTLRHQIEAIWPQESVLYARYALPAGARILDVGCGTGEATVRLAARFPGATTVIGVDLMPELLNVAIHDHGALAPRVQFEQGDGFALRYATGEFDLVVCRHVTQLLPNPEILLAELYRVLKPGGWLHVISEDYGMIHFPTRHGVDPDQLWHRAVVPFTDSQHTDARIGRRTLPMLRAIGLEHVNVRYLTLDTETVPRATLAGIFTAWRDGYVEGLAAASGLAPTDVRAMFNAILETIADPAAYGVWQLPVLAGRRPA
jgi:ubiquinone/menaquinone biosynthesis C-methylase UbiE